MGTTPGDERAAQLGGSVGDGRYVLGALLGEGGMAAVHKAHDTRLDRTVAVKTMHSELGRQDSFRQRFQREAQSVARLNHPNVVAVHDSGEQIVEGGLPVAYIVMEYVEGSSLSDVLRADMAAHGRMDVDKALKITGEVLAALGASHEHGMVHRDVKPANVMVTSRGEVKVMDFGIARAQESGVTSLTQTGMMVGTPQYLSPEQAEGKTVDGRSDLYSVGVMLFQLLTGKLPFDGDSAFTIAYKHVTEAPPRLADLHVSVDAGVQALLSRALEKDPARRFPTAEEMRAEIDRLRAGGHGAPAASPYGGAPRNLPPTSLEPPRYGTPGPQQQPQAVPPQQHGYGYPSPPPGFPTPQPQMPQPVPQMQPMPQYQQPAPQMMPSYVTPAPAHPMGYQQPMPHRPVAASAAPANTVATVGLVLSSISVPFVFVLLGFLTAIPGLICSIVGMKRSDAMAGTGRKAAITGIFLAVASLVIGVLWVIYLANQPSSDSY